MRRALGVDEVFISNLVPSPTTPDYKLKVVVKPGDQYLSRRVRFPSANRFRSQIEQLQQGT